MSTETQIEPEQVTTWDKPKAAHAVGNREWLPCTEAFFQDMLNVLPPVYVGTCWAVSEPWQHNVKGEEILLFFRARPRPACRMATRSEIKAELNGTAKPAAPVEPAARTDRPATESQARAALQALKHFMGGSQIAAIKQAMRGEEKQAFFDMLVKLAAHIAAMPQVYEQDGKGEAATVHLHYFKGSGDWHITERDTSEEQLQAFGLANLGHGSEIGYISIAELIQHGVELDLYWTPCTLAEIRAKE